MQSIREIVMGVDIGVKQSIVTSAYYGFGDETMYIAVTRHYEDAKEWIAEWIKRLSVYLQNFVRENGVNVIALEELNIEHMDINNNMKAYIRTLVSEIEDVSKRNNIRIEHVNPMNTSKMCSNCGKMGYREGTSYYCPHCGFDELADVNAAKNIGLRYILIQALKDKREGRNYKGKYFLATSRGQNPLENYQWVYNLLNSNSH